MSEKNIKVRLQQKHDTSANWALATNFKPKTGELIIYDDLKKMKVGDGETLVNNLPFLSAEVSQPDYNQNDSTASDYIKNRPFYDVGEAILFEQTFTTTLNDNSNIWESDSTIQLTVGDTVKVIFNGTEYTQEVKSLQGITYVGNAGLVEVAELETGEPFFVTNTRPATSEEGTTIVTREPQTNATIKIIKENIHYIDLKYLKNVLKFKDVPSEPTFAVNLLKQYGVNSYNNGSFAFTPDEFFTENGANFPCTMIVNGVPVIIALDNMSGFTVKGFDDSVRYATNKITYETDMDIAGTFTLSFPHSSGTFATQEYVNEQIGNIDTLLTALNSGTGV